MADQRDAVRRLLTDPERLCKGLGLMQDAVRQSGGLLIRCPAHAEKTPSCSVTRGPDGTVRFKCFGCELSGDGLTLVAAARELDIRRSSDFTSVLATAAEVMGDLWLADEIRGESRSTSPRPRLPQPPPPPPDRTYPDTREVEWLWGHAADVRDDAEVSGYLVGRRICPDTVTVRDLARVLQRLDKHNPDAAYVTESEMPTWARYQGRSWLSTGHRLLIRVFDADGSFRSVRAWRTCQGDSPKRLPAAGHRSTGLVMANEACQRMLRNRESPVELLVVEGESDFLTWCCRSSGPVLGIYSGSWSKEFGDRVPSGSSVVIRTDLDDAGRRYARSVVESLGKRCRVMAKQRDE
jgi:hypothetical protein